MNFVMTLIAPPAVAQFPAVAARIAAALGQGPDWLVPGLACDIACEDPASEALARRISGEVPVDVLVQPSAGRRKRVFVADLESTIIENEMLDELADFVGLRPHAAEITRRAMEGEMDFAAALQERVALLKGLPASVLDEAARRICLKPGAPELLATLRAAGVRTALVSGGFSVFAEPIAAGLGFERVVANRLDIREGQIAGTVAAPIANRETKRDTLFEMASDAGVPLSATLAIGDGANDLAMLDAAGLGIAFHAKPTVAAAARWRLDYADLTGVLYAQGYRRDEIIACWNGGVRRSPG